MRSARRSRIPRRTAFKLRLSTLLPGVGTIRNSGVSASQASSRAIVPLAREFSCARYRPASSTSKTGWYACVCQIALQALVIAQVVRRPSLGNRARSADAWGTEIPNCSVRSLRFMRPSQNRRKSMNSSRRSNAPTLSPLLGLAFHPLGVSFLRQIRSPVRIETILTSRHMRIFSYLIGISLSTALLRGGHSDGTQEEHRSHQQEGRIGRFQGPAQPSIQQSRQDCRRFGAGPEA